MVSDQLSKSFNLDELEKDYEGYAIPEFPNCEKRIHWLLSKSGRCHWCGARFEIDVTVTATVIEDE